MDTSPPESTSISLTTESLALHGGEEVKFDVHPSSKGMRSRSFMWSMMARKTFRVRRLNELGNACEIYANTMLPEVYEDALELLRDGVKIYVLRNLRLVWRFRDENYAAIYRMLTLSTAEAGRFLLLRCSSIGCS
jgi:hypothetical protein